MDDKDFFFQTSFVVIELGEKGKKIVVRGADLQNR